MIESELGENSSHFLLLQEQRRTLLQEPCVLLRFLNLQKLGNVQVVDELRNEEFTEEEVHEDGGEQKDLHTERQVLDEAGRRVRCEHGLAGVAFLVEDQVVESDRRELKFHEHVEHGDQRIGEGFEIEIR